MPVTVIGAAAHNKVVLVIGLVLLGVLVLDLAILTPLRIARRPKAPRE